MNLPNAYETVRQCAKEFAYQWAWSKHEKRENKCLAVSRVWLELSMAYYKVAQRRAKHGNRV